eukprot:TRINITY_DN24353_c0_g1_i3.p1 TRINITY_DN24353_c0_g1~~TRINITY_DN24353_c0_g1_i3.p1  ORF type:complete len:395 (-),score=51.72 TRINITY_DN24353_c0_g1_i3:373-1557(-)
MAERGARDTTALIEAASTVNSVTVKWTIRQSGGETSGYTPVTVQLAPAKGSGFSGMASLTRALNFTASRDEVFRQTINLDRSNLEGSSSFHFLDQNAEYEASVHVDGQALVTKQVSTKKNGEGLPGFLPMQLPRDMWRTYVGSEHKLDSWLGECPDDFVWVFEPSFDLYCTLWLNACFTLPNSGSPLVQCPNPVNRYCLDLTRDAPWLRSKKVKRHKNDFRLTVNSDYARTFKACEHTHRINGKGSWITPELVDALDRCRRQRSDIKVYAVELWEKSTGKLAAAIMSFSVGNIFHDYSTVTMLKDNRSAGAILTKVVGHLLKELGYTLWYWGFKNDYMAEYDERYGGMHISNKDFWQRWQAAREGAAKSPDAMPDLAQRVPSGEGLDLALLNPA